MNVQTVSQHRFAATTRRSIFAVLLLLSMSFAWLAYATGDAGCIIEDNSTDINYPAYSDTLTLAVSGADTAFASVAADIRYGTYAIRDALTIDTRPMGLIISLH